MMGTVSKFPLQLYKAARICEDFRLPCFVKDLTPDVVTVRIVTEHVAREDTRKRECDSMVIRWAPANSLNKSLGLGMKIS